MNVMPITVSAEANVSEAARLLRENKISGLPVLDGEKLVGIVCGVGPLEAPICRG